MFGCGVQFRVDGSSTREISNLTHTATLPVTIIGGYLGCGKTTLVNHLLRNANGNRLAILVNDFGELPIDADLIEAEDGDVISLTGGCVCCSYGNDLTAALINLQTLSPAPDHIMIEASGVALPGAIGGSLSLLRKLSLRCIVVMADVSTVMNYAQDKYLADTIERQITDADLILLNKLDLVSQTDAQATETWLNQINPQARVVCLTNSKISPSILLDDDHIKEISNAQAKTNADQPHDPTIFQTIEISLPKETDATALATNLASEPCSLVRAKGFVKDNDGEMKTVQVVGRRWSVSKAPAGVRTGIVCIGKTGGFTEESVRRCCGLTE